MSNSNFTFPIAVIDFEATALTHSSYPLEVGVALMQHPCAPIETWASLIAPDPAWDLASQWDPDAERLHGISRRDLAKGASPCNVMRQLNELVGAIGYAWCDGGGYDRHWLATLGDAAGIQPGFELRDINAAIGVDQLSAAGYRKALGRSKAPHRAGPDAERVCAALAELISPAELSHNDAQDRPHVETAAITWQEHCGGTCPVDPKIAVIVRLRSGRESDPAPASNWRWLSWPDGPSDFDIIAWRMPS